MKGLGNSIDGYKISKKIESIYMQTIYQILKEFISATNINSFLIKYLIQNNTEMKESKPISFYYKYKYN